MKQARLTTERVHLLVASAVAAVLALALGVAAAWPIYQTFWLLVPAGAALVIGWALATFGVSAWGLARSLIALVVAFVVSVVPVAVPGAIGSGVSGLMRGLADGTLGVVVGWKQLLTLTLPVGTYQATLVPAYVVFLLTAFIATLLAVRAGRFAALAAFVLMAPVAFGTLFGASSVSETLSIGPLRVTAPRELGLWLGAALLGAWWVWFAAGALRRAALRRGRAASNAARRSGASPGAGMLPARAFVAAGTLVLALIAGVALAPAFAGSARHVPRDDVQPEIVVRERISPLASYRASKGDAQIDEDMFEVSAAGVLPARLRLAVLDEYDGVDFHVSQDEAGRFTRFPSGAQVAEPTEVTVRVGPGYQDIWVPTAGLGSVPSFAGERASELADSFFVNREAEAAIVVPGGLRTKGLQPGDSITMRMSARADEQVAGAPSATPKIDLEQMPELAAWVKSQDQPASVEGVRALIETLRNRGYLSHAISESDTGSKWLARLSREYGSRFESSAGGHSVARLEKLFAQLNTQQRIAGPDAKPEMLVAGVGDDEQFAAAAALIARALGFESRVVIGVRLAGAGHLVKQIDGVPSCSATCTGDNLAAWVEVRGDGAAWAPLDVTPQAKMRPTALEQGEQLPEFATTPEERDAQEVDPPLGSGEQADHATDHAPEPGAFWLWPVLRAVGLGSAALALIAIPLLFLPFMKWRRAKRRRDEPRDELRALGAWNEMVDRAVDSGVTFSPGASKSEIAEAIGTAPARWAAHTSERAVFSAQGVSAEEADEMWDAVDADTATRLATANLGEKVRTRYALRSYGVSIRQWRKTAGAKVSPLKNDDRGAR